MMKATFLGTGTSQGVPMIGCDCMVCISENSRDKRLRSSLMLEYNQRTVVIDTGPDFRQQMLRGNVKNLDAVLFTHEHKDHVAGLDDIRAFNYFHNKPIDLYLSSLVEKSLRREFAYIFEEEKYPGIPQVELHIIKNEPFELFGKIFTPVEVKHYKLPVFGYIVDSLAYITDAKSIEKEEIKKLYGIKYLIINALRKQTHLSHLTLDEALEIIQIIRPEKAFLTHISHQLGRHDEIERQLPDNVKLGFDGLVLNL